MKTISLVSLITITCATLTAAAQESKNNNKEIDLPYVEIPSYPARYTAGNVAARIIDGLGFRYHWATAGLREEDLRFKPSPEARTSLETLMHIYQLSVIIVNATDKRPNMINGGTPSFSFSELRKKTLINLKSASDRLKSISDKDLENLKIVFQGNVQGTEFPFWNELNGPIADALWHVGQVVSFRRSSGNPFDERANVFTGKWKE